MAKTPNFRNPSGALGSDARSPISPSEGGMKLSPARNTPIPRQQQPGGRQVSQEMIAKRAYEIYISGKGGSQMENWLRAERELRGQ
jgi:hypothetical protein